MIEPEEVVNKSQDFLLTETVIVTEADASQLLFLLKARRTTGQLTFHLSQGGIQKVQLTERTKASENQKQKMRKMFGFE